MAQWIEQDFTRPDADLVRRLGQLSTGILADSMNRLQGLDGGIRPLRTGWKCSGPAFTIHCVEACNWGAHQALELARPGDVLVLALRGATTAAVWGHVMTDAAKRRGIAGVVIDGVARDLAENIADELPIFARGGAPNGPHKAWPCNLNVPVGIGSVAILPGDIMVGDDDGVVVIPAARAQAVLEEATRRALMEKEWYERLARGESTLDLLGIPRVEGDCE